MGQDFHCDPEDSYTDKHHTPQFLLGKGQEVWPTLPQGYQWALDLRLGAHFPCSDYPKGLKAPDMPSHCSKVSHLPEFSKRSQRKERH